MFAASLFLPLSLAMGSFFLSKSWVRRGLSIGAVLLMGAGVFVTMSRGAVLGLALIVLILHSENRIESPHCDRCSGDHSGPAADVRSPGGPR